MEKKKIIDLSMVAIFAAIIIVMSFTPLGYLTYGAISITFLAIPVAIGAILLGPKAGMILGLIFGITSLIQCFIGDPFGSLLLSINPVATAILCIVPRVLIGLFGGLVFKLFKEKNKILPYIMASLVVPISNTVLFIAGLYLFFGRTDAVTSILGMTNSETVVAFFLVVAGINAVVEAIACGFVASVVAKILYTMKVKIDKSVW